MEGRNLLFFPLFETMKSLFHMFYLSFKYPARLYRQTIQSFRLLLLESESLMFTWVLMYLAEALMVVDNGLYVNNIQA